MFEKMIVEIQQKKILHTNPESNSWFKIFFNNIKEYAYK